MLNVGEIFFLRKVHGQTVDPENIYTSGSIQIGQVLFINMYEYTYMHVTTIHEK